MYVNDVTVDMGKDGEKSIRRVFEMAKEKNLVADFELKMAQMFCMKNITFSITALQGIDNILCGNN